MHKAHIVRSIAKDLIECEDYPEDFNESVWVKLSPDPREIVSDKIKLAMIDSEKAIERIQIEAEYKDRAEIKKPRLRPKKNLKRLEWNTNLRRMNFGLDTIGKKTPVIIFI